MMKSLSVLIFFLCSSISFLRAQNDLLKELEQATPKDTEYALETFEGTRLVNGQSVETRGKGTLEFIIAHRFGAVDNGHYEMFGLDQAHVRLGLEYGITDRLGIGIGRSSLDKIKDGYLRYKICRQQNGATIFPITITAFGDVSYKSSPAVRYTSGARVAYVGQLLIARKFSSNLSLQLMPTFVHRNNVNTLTDNSDQLAMGFGGRLKVTRSIALTSEYYYRINPHIDSQYYNAIGFGIDIETGGHVFQLVMTNTSGTNERAFVTETNETFWDGGIHFGFNVTRTFQLKKKKTSGTI